jgi:hypothetical protein
LKLKSFLRNKFIEKLFYFLECPLALGREHEWEHQGVRLGLLVILRDRSITTRLATEGVLVVGGRRGGRN